MNTEDAEKWAKVYHELCAFRATAEAHEAQIQRLREAMGAVQNDVPLPKGVTEELINNELFWPVANIRTSKLNFDLLFRLLPTDGPFG
jgi:hypothetical protein